MSICKDLLKEDLLREPDSSAGGIRLISFLLNALAV